MPPDSSHPAIVADFLDALARADVDSAIALLTPDIAWLNTGLPTLRGTHVASALRRLSDGRVGFAVEIHAIAADGDTVLTDRTDYLAIGPAVTGFRVCGTFVLRDGLIATWDDHFSLRTFLTGLRFRRHGLRGVAPTAT